jgi:hypothetical protein
VPPTFAYFLALAAYLCFGAATLVLAAALAVVPVARVTAKRLAGGVIGSYPGVFLFQMLSMPVLISLWLLIWLLSRFILLSVAVGMAAAVLALGVFAVASLAGFMTGWSAGADVATGMSVTAAVGRTWLVRKIRVLRRS